MELDTDELSSSSSAVYSLPLLDCLGGQVKITS
jgi:hypothetical protein